MVIGTFLIGPYGDLLSFRISRFVCNVNPALFSISRHTMISLPNITANAVCGLRPQNTLLYPVHVTKLYELKMIGSVN
jgi:hypothetical protein